MNPQFAQVGQQFVDHYYKTFDSNRSQLAPLYGSNSMLTFENDQFQGADAIIKKLTSLPFAQVQHQIVTTDCQPNPSNNGVIVLVTGTLIVDGGATPLKYAQSFHIAPNPNQAGYYCVNDMFRLNYG